MLFIKNNAVLVVVDIRRILEPPVFSSQLEGNHPVVLSCGMIYAACISLVFPAEEAAWIACGFDIFCGGNCLGVFFRFGKVDCNVHFTIFSFAYPLDVSADSVTSYVIGVLAEFVEPVCGFFG